MVWDHLCRIACADHIDLVLILIHVRAFPLPELVIQSLPEKSAHLSVGHLEAF